MRLTRREFLRMLGIGGAAIMLPTPPVRAGAIWGGTPSEAKAPLATNIEPDMDWSKGQLRAAADFAAQLKPLCDSLDATLVALDSLPGRPNCRCAGVAAATRMESFINDLSRQDPNLLV